MKKPTRLLVFVVAVVLAGWYSLTTRKGTVPPGTTRYSQHAHGFSSRIRAFNKNPTVVFIAFIFAVIGSIWAFFYPLGGGRFIAGLLGSPQPEVIIRQVSVGDCVGYALAISTLRDEGVDSLDLTVQFPGVIADYASGASYLLDLNQNWRKGEGGFTLHEDPNGKCGIGPITSALPSPVFKVWKAGTGMVEVQGTTIPAGMTFGAVFAMSQKTPSLSLITHGSYEYRRLGFPISKPLDFLDSGHITTITPQGPWPLPPRAVPPTPAPVRT